MTRSILPFGLLLGGLAVFGLAAGVSAKPGNGKRGRQGPNGPPRMQARIAELGLTEESEAAALSILESTRTTHRALHEQMREAKGELQTLLEAEPLDEAAIMEQIDALGVLKTAARKSRVGTWMQVRALLTPEQRAAFGPPERGRGPRGGGCREGGAQARRRAP